MKKLLSLVLVAVMAVACFGFASAEDAKIKLGVILLHDEDSTYDNNFINAAKAVEEALGIELVLRRNVDESNACYEVACELADEGCNIVFADSFGHETYMIEAAKEYPEVEFCHATGTMAHTEKLDNFHNAFASIYEGRFLAGIAAGMKLNEIKAAGQLKGEVPMIGYVGAFTYAEVISGYTSFFLGARSVCPDVIMKVQFTGSWYDEAEEANAAKALIAAGCDLISQHADSMGAPSVCEAANIPNISYNGSTVDACPNTFIVASRIDWAPYLTFVCEKVAAGEKFDYDYTGTIATGSVKLTDINTAAAAEGTVEAIEAATAALNDGSLKVFATSTFTVEGAELTTYLADVDTDDAYTGDTEVIIDGEFSESTFRSAPYFSLAIDGIEQLNVAF
ncbi:MAG: BMP family ABC transporter substrate-binding protein [Clostridia bacterium]|nr:BMP family ABC transporter substrate-binding protein [Clostridia bacterium]MBR6499538.1 BMP family ABC transporter substrate-binding protein [Clostridia bacterium]